MRGFQQTVTTEILFYSHLLHMFNKQVINYSSTVVRSLKVFWHDLIKSTPESVEDPSEETELQKGLPTIDWILEGRYILHHDSKHLLGWDTAAFILGTGAIKVAKLQQQCLDERKYLKKKCASKKQLTPPSQDTSKRERHAGSRRFNLGWPTGFQSLSAANPLLQVAV